MELKVPISYVIDHEAMAEYLRQAFTGHLVRYQADRDRPVWVGWNMTTNQLGWAARIVGQRAPSPLVEHEAMFVHGCGLQIGAAVDFDETTMAIAVLLFAAEVAHQLCRRSPSSAGSACGREHLLCATEPAAVSDFAWPPTSS